MLKEKEGGPENPPDRKDTTTQDPTQEPKVSSALQHAARGLPVFPLTWLDTDGECSCRSSACGSPAKHPLIEGWPEVATTDKKRIAEWWETWPLANIAILTGTVVDVLDVDVKNGVDGSETLHELEIRHGILPETWRAVTPARGGSAHIYFKRCGWKCGVAVFGPGLDTRGHRGYVVGPGSFDARGRWEWDASSHPDEHELAEVPTWLISARMSKKDPPAGECAMDDGLELAPELIQQETTRWLDWAYRRVRGRGSSRQAVGFELGIQLRDGRFSFDQAMAAGAEYTEAVARSKDHPYTTRQFEESLRRVFKQPRRDPAHRLRIVRATVEERAAQIVEASGEAARRFRMEDVGNADRILTAHGQDLRFAEAIGWFTWDGSRFRQDLIQLHRLWAIEVQRTIYHEAMRAKSQEEQERLLRHARESGKSGRITGALKELSAFPEVAIHASQLDRDPWLLNTPSGTLNLRTGELLPHNRANLLTKLTGAAFQPDAICPRWEAFVLRAMNGDLQLVGYLQRAIGYALTGLQREKAFFVLQGAGDTGKSTMTEVLIFTLGDYAYQANPLTFEQDSGRRAGGAAPDLAALRGARFVLVPETGEGRRLDEALIKAVTGGEDLVARIPYAKSELTFKVEGKIFYATNHQPRLSEDPAIWLRVRKIPFRCVIPKPEQDKELREKLKLEAQGILAWILRGCLDWQRTGLDAPTAVQSATSEYRTDMDALAPWIEAECKVGVSMETSQDELYASYLRWHKRRDPEAKPFNLQSFVRRLGYREDIQRGQARRWRGIVLIETMRAVEAFRCPDCGKKEAKRTKKGVLICANCHP